MGTKKTVAAATWEDIDTLIPWDRNPRIKHPDEAAILARSMERLGFGAPLVVQVSGRRIIAGHSRREAALIYFQTHEKFPDAPGPRMVPARMRDLNDDDATAMTLADNKIAELSDWDPEKLSPILGELVELEFPMDDIGWTPEDLKEDTQQPSAATNPDPIEPEYTGPADSVMGQRYQLGRHTLICGDSMREETLNGVEADFVLTDPPYAIFGSSTGIAPDIADDRMVRPFFESTLRVCERILPMFGAACVFCDWRSWSAWSDSSRQTRMAVKNCIVWDKMSGGMGSNFGNIHEFVGYYIRMPVTNAMGDRETGVKPVFEPNLVHGARVTGAEREHNAQKPVAVLKWLISAVLDGRVTGSKIVDLFGGSGSTMIAAEESGAICTLVEINPTQCDRIRRRWTRYAIKHGIEVGEGGLAPKEP